MRFFEDLRPGDVIDLGSAVFDAGEIRAFAERFDPQPLHIDPVRAASLPFGGIIASGWHVGSSYMRLLVDGVLGDLASAGGPGVEALRLRRPVRPGDKLTATVTVTDARPSRHPEQGTVVFDGEMHDDEGRQVMTVRIYCRVLYVAS